MAQPMKALAFHIGMLLQVLAVLLSIQFSANVFAWQVVKFGPSGDTQTAAAHIGDLGELLGSLALH